MKVLKLHPGRCALRPLAWRWSLALWTALAVAACGSNSDDATIQGLAATGAAIANAKVSGRCASGPPVTGTTDGHGEFELGFTPAHTAPCLLQVTGGTPNVTLYSFASQIGSRINITPLTDLIVAKALGAEMDVAFDSFDAAQAKTIGDGLAAARTWVEAEVKGLTGQSYFSVDPITGVFVLGDANDKVLDQLGEARQKATRSHADWRQAATISTSLAVAIPLSFEVTTSNVFDAVGLSMAVPPMIKDFINQLARDVPESVFNTMAENKALRLAGQPSKARSASESACSAGGKILIQEEPGSLRMVFDGCKVTELTAATESDPEFSETRITDGAIVFSDSVLDGRPDAVKVTLSLNGHVTNSKGMDLQFTQAGSFITADDENGYVIRKMNVAARFRGHDDPESANYDNALEAVDFNVTANPKTGQATFNGMIRTGGFSQSGATLAGGAFRVDVVTPLSDDKTLGEYRITGANRTKVIIRLDPNGLFMGINGGPMEFVSWGA